MARTLSELVYEMMDGQMATTAEAICPECGSLARISAATWRDDAIAISIKCACTEIQMDGLPKWPQWEVLRVFNR